MKVQFGLPEIAFQSEDSTSKVKIFDGPLDISWHHCAITSVFIADLYAQHINAPHSEHKYLRHSIEYLANELIENAIKFRAHGDINIYSMIDSGNFIIKVSNIVDYNTYCSFRSHISEIMAGDPEALLIQKIERNAENPDSGASGLGLLTLMSDYDSRLAWEFEHSEEREGAFVETFGSIPIVTPQL